MELNVLSQFFMNSKRFLQKWFKVLVEKCQLNPGSKMAENLTGISSNKRVGVPQSQVSKQKMEENLMGKSSIAKVSSINKRSSKEYVSFYFSFKIFKVILCLKKQPCFGRIDKITLEQMKGKETKCPKGDLSDQREAKNETIEKVKHCANDMNRVQYPRQANQMMLTILEPKNELIVKMESEYENLTEKYQIIVSTSIDQTLSKVGKASSSFGRIDNFRREHLKLLDVKSKKTKEDRTNANSMSLNLGKASTNLNLAKSGELLCSEPVTQGKLLNNQSIWTQKLAEAALVNPINFWGQLSFPAPGIVQGARGYLVIHKTRGFICFLKTFTKMKFNMNGKTYKNDDNG